jgi:predicted PurR-regulated permease PerM
MKKSVATTKGPVLSLHKLRLMPQSSLETIITSASKISIIFMGLVMMIVALDLGEIILAPVFLGIVIGLMFSPVARRIENSGIPSSLSALLIVLVFIVLLAAIAIAFALPLSNWIAELPNIWNSLRLQIADWKSFFGSVTSFQTQIGDVLGKSGNMAVQVEGAGPVEHMLSLGPTVLAEVLLFLASIYFFIATRETFRATILSFCMSRKLRWQIANVFRDVEVLVSRYLFTISLINTGLGVAVAFSLWLLGMPSPLLWGGLAVVANYVSYIGPAIMFVIISSVSLASFSSGLDIALPPLVYISLHFLESQFVTSQVIGISMTMNPFIIFLALAFWIWLWGPVGGFIAIPSLLILYALIRNTVPTRP